MATSVRQYETGKLTGVPKLVIVWYRKNYPWVCFYCGSLLDSLTRTRDHVVPRCNGRGVPSHDNLVSCCAPCNVLKANRAVKEFRRNRGPVFWGEQRYLESAAYRKQISSGGNHGQAASKY